MQTAKCPRCKSATRYMSESKFYCPSCRALWQRHRLTGVMTEQTGSERYRKNA